MNKKLPRRKCHYEVCVNLVKLPNDKYCSLACHTAERFHVRLAKIIADGDASSIKDQRSIKKMVIHLRGRSCEICGLTEWREEPVPLILDHADGNSGNWKLENLRLVCGNCDMQLPTYKAKNLGSGRAYRRVRYADGKSY